MQNFQNSLCFCILVFPFIVFEDSWKKRFLLWSILSLSLFFVASNPNWLFMELGLLSFLCMGLLGKIDHKLTVADVFLCLSVLIKTKAIFFSTLLLITGAWLKISSGFSLRCTFRENKYANAIALLNQIFIFYLFCLFSDWSPLCLIFEGLIIFLWNGVCGLAETNLFKILKNQALIILGILFCLLGFQQIQTAKFLGLCSLFFVQGLAWLLNNVSWSVSGEQNLNSMGNLQKKIPVTYATFLCIMFTFFLTMGISILLTTSLPAFLIMIVFSLNEAALFLRLAWALFKKPFQFDERTEAYIKDAAIIRQISAGMLGVLACIFFAKNVFRSNFETFDWINILFVSIFIGTFATICAFILHYPCLFKRLRLQQVYFTFRKKIKRLQIFKLTTSKFVHKMWANHKAFLQLWIKMTRGVTSLMNNLYQYCVSLFYKINFFSPYDFAKNLRFLFIVFFILIFVLIL